MENNKLSSNHKKAVYDWWNSENTKKWHKEKYNNDNVEYPHVIDRLNKAINFIEKIKPSKDCKILEFGFGGGHSSLKILELGYNYTGVEISKHMISSAKDKCSKYIENGKAKFIHGSLDEINSELNSQKYDVVLICGALQYAENINFAMSQIFNLLNKKGLFVICQANMFAIHEFFGFRKSIKSIIRLIKKEEFFYSYSNSFKSMLLETKLKTYFEKYKDTKLMNSKFMTKYDEKWKYKINKRLFSNKSLSDHITNSGLKILTKTGSPFLLFHKNKILNYIYIFFNSFLEILVNKFKLKFLINIADNIIIVSEKDV